MKGFAARNPRQRIFLLATGNKGVRDRICPRAPDELARLDLLAVTTSRQSGGEDVIECGIAWGPVEFAADLFRTGDERWGIAGSTRRCDKGHLPARDTACRGDDFANAEPCAVADVVDALIGVFKRAEDEQVGVGDVVNMDVVADASAIGSRIVGAENGDRAGRTESGTQYIGDEVRFGLMAFGVPVPRPGGVEVAEDGIPESMNLTKPFQHDLALQLGLAVGIDGELRRVFANGYGLRHAKNGAGGRENEASDAMTEAGFEKSKRCGGVVAEIERRVLHGFGDFGESGEVHDGVDGRSGEELIENCGVSDIADEQASGGRDCVAMAAGEVIEHGDLKVLL